MHKQYFETESGNFLKKALYWAEQFPGFILLNGNDKAFPCDAFPRELAVKPKRELVCNAGTNKDSIACLKTFQHEAASAIYGYITYELKNELEHLDSSNPAQYNLPALYFFEPEIILYFQDKGVEIAGYDETTCKEIFHAIINTSPPVMTDPQVQSIIAGTSRESYIDKLKKIREHIQSGDIYEINYCINFYATQACINPVHTYLKLNELSPMPFSVFVKHKGFYMAGASPERFLKKTGDKVISQPIKGTAKRSTHEAKDRQLKETLQHSEKEIAENMMIVDLVRNDLARTCLPGSVKAEELFGIYAFEHVYQMISTVSGRLKPTHHYAEALKNAFPMGSMTGAPKIMAMNLIDRFENFKRELFSGTVGKIETNSDFDFNVVIRSIFYEQTRQYLSFAVGSAITFDADPEKEYQECLLKAKAINQVLNPSYSPETE